MAKRQKVKRLSGIKKKTVYRDAQGRFTSKEESFREEEWTFRTDAKNRIKDLRVTGDIVSSWQTYHYPTVPIPERGSRQGKISAQIAKYMREIGALRRASEITVHMTAKTYHGKIIRRKISWQTYHMGDKLIDSASAIIMKELFYKHDDRPAYPVEIVKGWRKRKSTKKEALKRRQLHDVRFTIKSEIL